MSTEISRSSARRMARVNLEFLPAVIIDAGENASQRFIEFFTANIRNKNTRMASVRALVPFFRWCEERGIGLHAVQPVTVAAHESPRTTKLYDRTDDEITLDEVERILI